MKIEYLKIKNYKQFADLELDLIYPKGHPKEGQPLDKICIIGQSGTGKTNLLEIIKKSMVDFSGQPKTSDVVFSEFVGESTDDRYIRSKFETLNKTKLDTLFIPDKIKTNFREVTEIFENEKSYFIGVNKTYSSFSNFENVMSPSDRILLEEFYSYRKTLIEQGISIHGIASFPKKLKEVDEKILNLKKQYGQDENVSESVRKLEQMNFINKRVIDINEKNDSWDLLKKRIEYYEQEKKTYKNKLFDKVLSDPNFAQQSIEKMKKWEEENENILEKMAGDINFIIKKFNLQLQINETTNSYDELIIKDLSNENIIKYDDLSTGTKNLLSTFIPLKSYNPKDSIILIDEPENSFYPDIQRQLTDLYMNVGENNQLIMATHSPLIAASFEPWEVVELKFDANNQIYREQYYEGEENHVDNYTLDPRLLTWTSILVDIFDLKEDSNFSFREKKLMEYATLKAEIKLMESGEKKTAKIKQFKKLSQLLGLQN